MRCSILRRAANIGPVDLLREYVDVQDVPNILSHRFPGSGA